MADFALLKYTKLISRKIWVIQKSWKFHTVFWNQLGTLRSPEIINMSWINNHQIASYLWRPPKWVTALFSSSKAAAPLRCCSSRSLADTLGTTNLLGTLGNSLPTPGVVTEAVGCTFVGPEAVGLLRILLVPATWNFNRMQKSAKIFTLHMCLCYEGIFDFCENK